MKIGTIAMINRLPYAIAMPSGVDGILAVPFMAVAFSVAFTDKSAVCSLATLSPMLTWI